MNVIIVDDELAGRRTLRELCEAEGDLKVVGEYGDGTAALAAHQIALQVATIMFMVTPAMMNSNLCQNGWV